MDSIITTFHIDWKLMLAQLANFAVVVFVLWYFVFKPLAVKMIDRTKMIEKGLEEAENAAKKIIEADANKEKIINQAHKDAQVILEKANERTKINADEIVLKAKEETKSIIESAKKEIRSEQEKSLAEAKKDVVDVVIKMTEKILQEKFDSKKDKDFIDSAIKKI